MQRPHAVADVQDDEVRLRQRQMVCRCLPAVLRVVHKMREKITSVRDRCNIFLNRICTFRLCSAQDQPLHVNVKMRMLYVKFVT